jgi:GH15 family glucan-1,4-alpha-glucosidase
LADAITARTSATSLHPTGRWQRSPGDPGLDAALLLPPLRGAVPADDPRTLATLNAYQQELTENGYAYRFRHDPRPLGRAEGAFSFCGFLLSLALHQQDRPVEATAWYERTRACCGPPALFSEEYDTLEHQMRGNLPQAFVHALHLECTARINPPDTVPGTTATAATTTARTPADDTG